MIERAVDYVIQEWKLVLFLALCIIVAGLVELRDLNIEAYPDPSPPEVEVTTQCGNWSAEEIEQQITIPLETVFNGVPRLEHMRTISLFGVSDIKMYFSYDSSFDADRQEVINRMGMATLPPGIEPGINPDSAVGEIYRFELTGDSRYTLLDLKEAADWTCVRYFKQVPGIQDVATFGGPTKEFHVDLDPQLLVAYHVSVPQVMTALANANANTGGEYLTIGSQAYDVRGIGLFKTLEDIENVVVVEKNGVPVYVRQLGRVSIGRAVPLGRVGRDGVDDVVQGIVLMRIGGQSIPTTRGVEQMAEKLNRLILPKGMHLTPYVDRMDLIGVTTHTVEHTLVSGMLLVALILIIFLGDFRAALIVALTIPLSLCIVFIVMVWRHDSANLISMGAIDFGIIVDASVIMIENVHRHLMEKDAVQSPRLVTSQAAREVASPILFATMALFVSFLPLFTMTGPEGRIFGPMALTYGIALMSALMLAFTFAPAAASRFLRPGTDHETMVMRILRPPYRALLRSAVRHPYVTMVGTLLALGLTIAVIPRLGAEFMPRLEEGNLWVRATMPTSISYDDSSEVVRKLRTFFDGYPEVQTVVSQLGRPDDASDVVSYFNAEFYVGLKPFEQWPAGLTKDALVSRMNDRLTKMMPGVIFNFSQNIEDNVEEALSGVKGINSVKIFGPDLDKLEAYATQVYDIMQGVHGVEDLGIFHALGQPDSLIATDRKAAARYGLEVADVDGIVSAAIGGTSATQLLDGNKSFNVKVRLMAPYRSSIEAIRRIPIVSPDGEAVPLGDVALIQNKTGAGYIYRENNERYIPVKFSVRGRDLEGAVAEADAKIRRQIKLPDGYYVEWAGEIEHLVGAYQRLRVIVPLTLLIILFILGKTFNNVADGMLILFTVPLACIGEVWALYARAMPMSISAGIGFISLLGVCTLEGVLLVSRIKHHAHEGLDIFEAVVAGAEQRLRPVMMVGFTAAIGLLPMALATGIGSETQRPLATVVVVGMLTSAVVNLLIHPALIYLLHRSGLAGSLSDTHGATISNESEEPS